LKENKKTQFSFLTTTGRFPWTTRTRKKEHFFLQTTSIFPPTTKKGTFLKIEKIAYFCYIDGAKIVFNYSLKNSEK